MGVERGRGHLGKGGIQSEARRLALKAQLAEEAERPWFLCNKPVPFKIDQDLAGTVRTLMVKHGDRDWDGEISAVEEIYQSYIGNRG